MPWLALPWSVSTAEPALGFVRAARREQGLAQGALAAAAGVRVG
jgi:hypothetical protein